MKQKDFFSANVKHWHGAAKRQLISSMLLSKPNLGLQPVLEPHAKVQQRR